MAEARKQTSRRWLWIGLAVVLIVVFLVARSFLRERLPVRMVRVAHATLINTVSTNGRVEPVVNYQFYSPLATTVKTVDVQEGDQVPRGKLLIALDDVQARAQVAAAESGVKTAEATIYAATHNGTLAEQQAAQSEQEQDRLARDQAQHDLDAMTQLASSGAAAAGEVTAARERLQTAEASLAAAQRSAQGHYGPVDIARTQAALADAQAALAAAQHVEAQTSYYAPVSGTVYNLNASATEFAEQGKLLLEMADLHQVRVRAYFDEPDIGHLAEGQKVTISWDAKPGSEWRGHIVRLPSTVVTYTTRNVGEVLVDFDDGGDGLLPDTNVTVNVTISSEANALSIPREALHEENGKYFVFKLVNGELKRTTVTIGAPNLTEVPIVSGVTEGDSVATGTTNGQPLQEDIPIKEER
jgi:HlyD family secretion protein